MNKKLISEQLRALAQGDEQRTKAARLREVADDVEAALAAGVRRTAVLDVLRDQGLDMTLSTFDTTLKRIRAAGSKGRAGVAPHHRTGPKQPTAGPRSPVPPPGAHSPAALDQIIGTPPDLHSLAKIGRRKSPP